MSSIEELSAADRACIGELWREAHHSELTVGSAYATVVVELYELGAGVEVIRLATKAAHDEVRHAEQCRMLAERYLGDAVPARKPMRANMPSHPGAGDVLRKHLHVVSISCINESLAVGYAEACLSGTSCDEIRPVLKTHLEDEIDHARVGWAHLASLETTTREQIGGFVPRLLRASLARWKSSMERLPEAGFREHGYPPRSELLANADQTVREVIIPGFAAVGVPLPSGDASSLYGND